MKIIYVVLGLGAGALAVATPYLWPIVLAWCDRNLLILLILSPYALAVILFLTLIGLLIASVIFMLNS